MTFFAFGLNHETAPVACRERFGFSDDVARRLYRILPRSGTAELVLLSTCNRTEGYLYGTEADVAAVQQVLAMRAGMPWPEAHAFLVRDEAAVRHVLQVAAGLRSLVLGDGQILSQLKAAYRLADDAEAVGTVMHRLMHTAFRVAKQVLTGTDLARGAVSVSGAAVAAARRRLAADGRRLAESRVLVLGAGEMARLAVEAFRREGVAALAVANRTAARARALDADALAWEARHAALATADVVLVATAAPAPVLTAAGAPARRGAPALVLDIAVPRNVEPALGALPGYALVDLDALEADRAEAQAARCAHVPAAEALCEEALAEFVSWSFHQQALQPAIQAIRDTFEHIRRTEIARHAHRFDPADRGELERLTQSIMQKLLAVPVVRLKSTDPESIDFVRGIRLLHLLFSRPGCDDAPPEEASAACPFAAYLSDGPLPPDAVRAALRGLEA